MEVGMGDKGISILIVEDSQTLQEVFSDALRRNGYRVESAYSLHQAKQRLKEGEFHCALIDLVLPDGNGLELLREIQESRRDIASIIMTAHESEDSAVQTVLLGGYEYVIKPIKPMDLKIIVQAALKRREVERKRERQVQERLQAERMLSDTIIASQLDLIFVIDNKGMITRVNNIVSHTLGYSREELIGKSITDFFPKGRKEEQFQRGLCPGIGGNCIQDEELFLVAKDGREIPFLFNGFPLRDGKGAVIGAVAVGRNMRKIKDYIAQLEATRDQLQGKIEELERFHRLAVDRELRMVQLKKELEELRKKLKQKGG
jgi:PAS domain S-box-containing protein